MANYRYVYEYNGKRYVIEAPEGATEADLQSIIASAPAPKAPPPAPKPQPKPTADASSYFPKGIGTPGFKTSGFNQPSALPKGATTKDVKTRYDLNRRNLPQDFQPPREPVSGPQPETISAPRGPEGGFISGAKGIAQEISALPYAARQMTTELFGTPGRAVESIFSPFLIGYGYKDTGQKIDEALGLTSPVERARQAAAQERYGPLATRSREEAQAATQSFESQLAQPEFDSIVGRGLYSGASSFVQMLPGVAASALTKSFAPATANIAAITAPTAYQKYRERGGTVEEARLGAGAETAIELATEALPLGVLVNRLGKAGFGSFLKSYLGRELPSELVATITQNAVDTAIANPDKTWSDYAKELPGALAETAVATLVPGTILAGASKGIQIADRLAGRTQPAPPPPPPPPPPPAEEAIVPPAPTPPPAAEEAPPPTPATAAPLPAVGAAEIIRSLGPVGSKITLQEPSGPQEYTYQGIDEDGSVLLADENGVIFAEDPEQIAAAIEPRTAAPEGEVGGMGFGIDITEGLPPVEAAPAPVAAAEESIAAPEPKIFPVDKEVASYMDEYSRFRSADQMNQIMLMATDLAREKGKRSISRDELFNAAMQFDDQMAARGRPAPTAAPAAPTQPTQMSPEDAKELADEQDFLERLEDDLAYISETRAENAYEGEDPETKAAYEQDIAELEASRQERLRNIEAIKAKYAAPAAPAAPTGLQDLQPELERIMGKFHPQLREMFILPKIQEQIASGKPFTVKNIPDALRKNIPQADRLIVARALAENPQQLIDVANSVPFTTPVGDIVYPTAAQPQAEAAPEVAPEAPPAKRLTLTKATPTQWMGNQMGTQAATWKVKEYPGWTVWNNGTDWVATHEGRPNVKSYTKPMLLEKLGRVLAAEEAAPEAAPPAPPRAVGKKARATIPATRKKVDVQYELMDLGDIRFAEGELQNRDRSRPQTQQFLRRFVSTFDPEGLGEDKSTDRGAPIINADNVILSGNGRTMGIEEIYDKHPEEAEAYRQFLRDEGYNIEGIDRPFLVRRILSDIDQREFVVSSNEPDIAALSPPEQAAQDATDILTPDVMAKFYGGDLTLAKNDGFVSAFIMKLSPQQRENAMDDKGKVSAQVMQRMKNALLYKAFGGAGRASDIFISKAMERADDDTRSLTNALVDASADWIKFKSDIKAGKIDPKYDITDKILEAIAAVSDIKTGRKMKVDYYLRSEDLVDPLPKFVRQILLAFHNESVTRFRSKKAIAQLLRDYADKAAEQQAAPDMLGKAETPSAQEVWRAVDREQPSEETEDEGPRLMAPPEEAGAAAPNFYQPIFAQAGRIPSLRREIAYLVKLRNEGKIGDDDFIREVEDIEFFVKQMSDAKRWRDRGKPRLRGADRIREVILGAKRRGEITEEAADFLEWFALRNPHLLDDLGISIKKKGRKDYAASYLVLTRIMRLVKGSPGKTGGVHEIMHHLERMMPQDIRDAIKKSWAAELDKAEAEDYPGKDYNDKLFFRAVRAFHENKKVKLQKDEYTPEEAYKFADNLIRSGKVDGNLYQYLNPSEFWAVNATKILEARYDVQGSLLGRLKNWLRELSTKMKGLFKLDPKAPILKALDSLAKGDGKFVSNQMLEEKLERLGEDNVVDMNAKRSAALAEDLNEIEADVKSLEQAMKNEPQGIAQMSLSIDRALTSTLERVNDILDEAPPELDRQLQRVSDKIKNLKAIAKASVKPVNENIEKAETAYEKTERELLEAEDALNDFWFNQKDDRQMMNPRSKEYKAWAAEFAKKQDAYQAAKDRFDMARAAQDEAVYYALLGGTPDEMKKAVANAMQYENKIIKEGADLQKKNRGCD